MPQYTTPDSIAKWTDTDPVSIVKASQAMGDSIQTALDKRQRYDFVWANDSERTSQTGMVAGSRGYQVNTRNEYIYENSAWRLVTMYFEGTASTISLGSPSNTGIGSGTGLTQHANTTDGSFLTVSALSVNITTPGVYGISVLGRENTSLAVTGQLTISKSSSYTSVANRIGVEQFGGEPMAVVTSPFVRVTSTQNIYFFFYNNSGANRTINSVVSIARIS